MLLENQVCLLSIISGHPTIWKFQVGRSDIFYHLSSTCVLEYPASLTEGFGFMLKEFSIRICSWNLWCVQLGFRKEFKSLLLQWWMASQIPGMIIWLVTMPAYSDFVKSLPSSCLKLWVYSCVHHHQEGTCSSSTVHLCQVYWIKRWVENEVMSMLTMLEDRPILHHSQCLCIPVLCTDCNLIARQLTDFLSLPCTASPSSGCKDVSLAQYMFSSMPTVAQSLDSLL